MTALPRFSGNRSQHQLKAALRRTARSCAWRAGILLLAIGTCAGASAAETATTQGGSLRLLNGGVSNGVAHLGLEIAMQPGWHTYWRYPGDSGVPPEITLDANAAAKAEVTGLSIAFPAPERFGPSGDETIGYEGDVILPIDARLSGPATSTPLSITVRLGICRDICLPVEETLTTTLNPLPPTAAMDATTLAEAQKSVPKEVASDAPMSVADLKVDASIKPARAEVTINAADSDVADVFVEGPDGWALPLPKRMPPEGNRSHWQFALDGLPSGTQWPGARLTFTIVGTQTAAVQSRTIK